MKHTCNRSSLIVNNIPTLGILCFVLLYLYATTLYPGGSQANANAEGFDWVHNYWCNLMNEKARNGLVNPAQPFSVLALFILCLSLMVFFIQFAEFFTENKRWKRILQFSGVSSMLCGMFLFTSLHDLMTLLSSFFGLFVIIGIIKTVYKSALSHYKRTGIVCILLLGLNNCIYYTSQWIEWLPLLQKITFLLVLSWVLGLNHQLRKKIMTCLQDGV